MGYQDVETICVGTYQLYQFILLNVGSSVMLIPYHFDGNMGFGTGM